jgi:soluble lytic murein transglycosylase-like protein
MTNTDATNALGRAILSLDNPAIREGALHWTDTAERATAITEVTRALADAVEILKQQDERSAACTKLQEIERNYQSLTAAQLKDELLQVQEMLGDNRQTHRFFRAAAVGTMIAAGAAATTGTIHQAPPAQFQQQWQQARKDPSSLLKRTQGLQEAQEFARTCGAPVNIISVGSEFWVVRQQVPPQDQQQDPEQALRQKVPYYDNLKAKAAEMESATSNRFRQIIDDAVKRYPLTGNQEIDRMIVEAVIWQESKGDPKAQNQAWHGLMQLDKKIFAKYHYGRSGATQNFPSYYHGVKHKLLGIKIRGSKIAGHNCSVFDPAANIDAGVHLLADYFTHKEVYQAPADLPYVLKAFNAGPSQAAEDKANAQIPNYAKLVLGIQSTRGLAFCSFLDRPF